MLAAQCSTRNALKEPFFPGDVGFAKSSLKCQFCSLNFLERIPGFPWLNSAQNRLKAAKLDLKLAANRLRSAKFAKKELFVSQLRHRESTYNLSNSQKQFSGSDVRPHIFGVTWCPTDASTAV